MMNVALEQWLFQPGSRRKKGEYNFKIRHSHWNLLHMLFVTTMT